MRALTFLVVALFITACGDSGSDVPASPGGGGSAAGGGSAGVAQGGTATGGGDAGGGLAGSGSGGVAGADGGNADSGGAPAKTARPGHYIFMLPADGPAEIVDALRPGVRGVGIRYTWRSLEPSEGQYDFGQLSSDLDLLAANGAVEIALVEDKSFDSTVPTPDYLSTQTLPNIPGGFTAVRWDPDVRNHMKALMQAIGTAFDAHPGLEGIAIQESAPSLTDAQLTASGYTPELYRDTLTDLLTTMKQALPRSGVFWYMNFLPQKQSYIGSIAAAVAPLGVSMGGPDILPESQPLLTQTYPFYDQFQGQMTLFCSAQYASYEHVKSSTGEYYTPEEIFDFARDDLHVSYVFWNRKTWNTPLGSYNWLDALPVIAQNPSFN
jgi:hypothetical protein